MRGQSCPFVVKRDKGRGEGQAGGPCSCLLSAPSRLPLQRPPPFYTWGHSGSAGGRLDPGLNRLPLPLARALSTSGFCPNSSWHDCDSRPWTCPQSLSSRPSRLWDPHPLASLVGKGWGRSCSPWYVQSSPWLPRPASPQVGSPPTPQCCVSLSPASSSLQPPLDPSIISVWHACPGPRTPPPPPPQAQSPARINRSGLQRHCHPSPFYNPTPTPPARPDPPPCQGGSPGPREPGEGRSEPAWGRGGVPPNARPLSGPGWPL